jgi:putative transposase
LVVRDPAEPEEEKKKFKPLKWRWIVERTFAWVGRNRRLSKDYEGSEESGESWIYLAMIHLILRHLDPA